VSQDVLVGLDVGTTGVKAVAVSPGGRILASASEEYEPDAATRLGRA
jgi:sugar (pentulose or hexulose) kinase